MWLPEILWCLCVLGATASAFKPSTWKWLHGNRRASKSASSFSSSSSSPAPASSSAESSDASRPFELSSVPLDVVVEPGFDAVPHTLPAGSSVYEFSSGLLLVCFEDRILFAATHSVRRSRRAPPNTLVTLSSVRTPNNRDVNLVLTNLDKPNLVAQIASYSFFAKKDYGTVDFFSGTFNLPSLMVWHYRDVPPLSGPVEESRRARRWYADFKLAVLDKVGLTQQRETSAERFWERCSPRVYNTKAMQQTQEEEHYLPTYEEVQHVQGSLPTYEEVSEMNANGNQNRVEQQTQPLQRLEQLFQDARMKCRWYIPYTVFDKFDGNTATVLNVSKVENVGQGKMKLYGKLQPPSGIRLSVRSGNLKKLATLYCPNTPAETKIVDDIYNVLNTPKSSTSSSKRSTTPSLQIPLSIRRATTTPGQQHTELNLMAEGLENAVSTLFSASAFTTVEGWANYFTVNDYRLVYLLEEALQPRMMSIRHIPQQCRAALFTALNFLSRKPMKPRISRANQLAMYQGSDSDMPDLVALLF